MESKKTLFIRQLNQLNSGYKAQQRSAMDDRKFGTMCRSCQHSWRSLT